MFINKTSLSVKVRINNHSQVKINLDISQYKKVLKKKLYLIILDRSYIKKYIANYIV